jgi:excisionase family DNA binding protein
MKWGKSPATDVDRLVHQLETLFVELRRFERDADGSEEARAKLAAFKRDAVEQLHDLVPAIWRLLDEAEFWRPGSLENFNELCFSLPEARQTSHTWGPFLGKIRRLLLDSVAVKGQASAASAAKPNGHTAESAAPVQFVSGLGGSAVGHTKAHHGQVEGRSRATTSKRLFNTEEAADFLGRTKEAVQHLIAAGKIPTVRSDRRVFLDREDLERWIQSGKV